MNSLRLPSIFRLYMVLHETDMTDTYQQLTELKVAMDSPLILRNDFSV